MPWTENIFGIKLYSTGIVVWGHDYVNMEQRTLYYIQVLFLLIGYKSFNGIVKHDGQDDTASFQSGNYPGNSGPGPWITLSVTLLSPVLDRGPSSWGSPWPRTCHSYTDPPDTCTQSCSPSPRYNSQPRLTNTTSGQLKIVGIGQTFN